MRIFKYIRNFFYNFLRLLKIAAESDIMYWDHLVGSVSDNCSIDKDAVVLNTHALTNVVIGKGTYIANEAVIMNTVIGKFCSIGPNLKCGWGIHPLNGISTSPVFYSKQTELGFSFSSEDKCEEHMGITIGNDVFIGRNVIVLDGVIIGDGAVIGAGSVVSKNIPPYAIAVGSPIKIIKYRFAQDVIDELLEAKWWNQDDEVLAQVERNFFDVESFLKVMKRN